MLGTLTEVVIRGKKGLGLLIIRTKLRFIDEKFVYYEFKREWEGERNNGIVHCKFYVDESIDGCPIDNSMMRGLLKGSSMFFQALTFSMSVL